MGRDPSVKQKPVSRRFGWGTVALCCAFAHVATALGTTIVYKEFSWENTALLQSEFAEIPQKEPEKAKDWGLLPQAPLPNAPSAVEQAVVQKKPRPQQNTSWSVFALKPSEKPRELAAVAPRDTVLSIETPQFDFRAQSILQTPPPSVPKAKPLQVAHRQSVLQKEQAVQQGHLWEDEGEGAEASIFSLEAQGHVEEVLPSTTSEEIGLLASIETGPSLNAPIPLYPRTSPRASQEDAALTIAAVGDIMIGANILRQSGLPKAKPLDPALAAILQKADLAVGNLEGVISQERLTARSCSSGKCYRFLMAAPAADFLAQAGFDFLGLANNHANDFGLKGHIHTRQHLTRVGIGYAGHRSRKNQQKAKGALASRMVNGVKVGFLSFGTSSCCHDLRDHKNAMALIAARADQVDVLIVAFHGGGEGRRRTRLPKAKEVFLGMDRGDVYAFGRGAVDHGADLVLGSGPHVPRAAEIYNNRLIAYSLGNFWTPQDMSLIGAGGLAPLLWARLAADGRLVTHSVVSAVQRKGQSPILDPQRRAARMIDELTRLDFPDAQTPSVLAEVR